MMYAFRHTVFVSALGYVASVEKRALLIIWHEQVFLNIVLDEAVEEKAGGEKVRIGMVV